MRRKLLFWYASSIVNGFWKSTHEGAYTTNIISNTARFHGPIAHKIPPNLLIFLVFKEPFFQLAESASVLLGLYNKRQRRPV